MTTTPQNPSPYESAMLALRAAGERESVTRYKNDAAAVLAEVAALLGSSESWDGADLLEAIAESVHGATGAAGLPDPAESSDESLTYWRTVADDLGIEHDGPELDDDDEEGEE